VKLVYPILSKVQIGMISSFLVTWFDKVRETEKQEFLSCAGLSKGFPPRWRVMNFERRVAKKRASREKFFTYDVGGEGGVCFAA